MKRKIPFSLLCGFIFFFILLSKGVSHAVTEGDAINDDEVAQSEEKKDTDGDGVEDAEEIRRGTSPEQCDSDEDGLSDGVELQIISPKGESGCHGLAPGGTNYARPKEMDPLNTDSDGDGLSDGEEDRDGNGWVARDESDPSHLDSDADGLGDGIENNGDFDRDGFPDFDIKKIVGSGNCLRPTSVDDIDCDTIPNARDDDSDHDGCSDKEEGENDQNENGIPDVFDPQALSCSTKTTGAGNFGGGGGGGNLAPADNEHVDEVPVLPNWVREGVGGPSCSLSEGVQKSISPYFLYLLALFLMFLPRNIMRR